MANIFNTTISYITELEVKDTTNKTSLKTLADADVKILIAKAESIVNNYVGYSFDILDINTSVETKKDIKIATFYIVEQLFENADNIIAISNVGNIIRTEAGDRKEHYSESIDKEGVIGIPLQSKQILDMYKQVFFKQVL